MVSRVVVDGEEDLNPRKTETFKFNSWRFYAPQETVFGLSEQFDLVPLSYLIDRPLS
jgi:hypothetical protein